MKGPFLTTVLEAMSAVKPDITANHSGAKEAVLDKETGFLVNPNNIEEFANSIVRLVDRKKDLPKIGARAKLRYQKIFTTKHFNKKWLKFNLAHDLI